MKPEILMTSVGLILLCASASASRYSKYKTTGALYHPTQRKSPYFCAEKFYFCMRSSKDNFQPTVHGCESRMYRKYMCSKESIHRKITAEDKRKFALHSPVTRHLSSEYTNDSLDYEYDDKPLGVRPPGQDSGDVGGADLTIGEISDQTSHISDGQMAL